MDPGGPDAPRAAIERRLRSLAVFEAANIPLQAVIWFGVLGLPGSAANLAGFALFVLLLAEGTAYWAAKLRQLRRAGRRLPGLAFFRVVRVVNVPLLAAGLALAGYAVATDPGRASWPGLGFAVFAVLEHVNYFHLQLMHDTVADWRRLRRGGLHRSHLARDLRTRNRPGRQYIRLPPPA
ncbi:hypothetical protein AB0M79_24085 [Polymorphospora sp. NPDC051019]|uniref:hypothetical protein n=1 Tax=Polymorphospora sp. NPDC051019 TaxID=3155725 RepID=UPI00343DCD1A